MANLREIERTKYLANAIDKVSTSCLTVGVFAPIAAALYSSSAAWLRPAHLLPAPSVGFRPPLHYIRQEDVHSRAAIMNGIQIFAFIVLPAIIAAGGWIAVLANERHNRLKHSVHPGE